MNHVWYLCIPPAAAGLVLPRELPEDYFSPGAYVLVGKRADLDAEYVFLAIDKDKEVSTTLRRRADGRFEVIYTSYPTFVFEARAVHPAYRTYLGDDARLREAKAFCFLHPLHRGVLEEVCQAHGFYFVGYVGASGRGDREPRGPEPRS